MKILLLNQEGYQREECCTGKIMLKILPSQIFLAGAYLRKNGKDVTVVDVQTQKFPDLSKFDVIVVWVSTLGGYYSDLKALEKAKELGKKTILILNDPFGVELDVMEKNSFIDVCIRLYEREIVLDKVISYLEKNKEFDFPGVIYRKNKLIDTSVMPFLKDLTHLGSCREFLEELDLSKYDEAFITTGRGCVMNCTFCQYPRTSVRKRKIKDIIDETEIISSKIKNYNFLDLDMCTDLVWTNKFLDEMIKRRFGGNWVTDMRSEQAKPELLKKYNKAGCNRLLVGVESLDDFILEKINKKISKKVTEEGILTILKAKINPITSLMIGFPWDSNKTLKKTENFLKKMSISLYGVSYVVPIKGTVLYNDFRKLGLLKKDLEVEDYVNASEYPIAPTLYLSKEDIIGWNKRLQKLRFNPVYLTNYILKNGFKLRYFRSIFKRIQNYHHT